MIIRILLTILFLASVASAQTFKVWNANVQHGEGTDGSANYTRQTDILKSRNADVLLLQERTTGDTGWDSGLSEFDEVVYRENDPGQNDGPSIWVRNSTVTVLDEYEIDLSNGAIGWDGSTNVDKAAVGVRVVIQGKTVFIFNTHLAWSAGADCNGCQTSAIREAQIATLISWINSIVGSDKNWMIGGDMNFSPTMPKISGGFQIDLFTDAGLLNARTLANNSGYFWVEWGDRNSDGIHDNLKSSPITHDTREIDYFFIHEDATEIRFQSLEIPDLRAQCPHGLVSGGSMPACTPEVTALWDNEGDFGVRPSDHNWLLLTVSINNTAIPTSYNGLTHRNSIAFPSMTGDLDFSDAGHKRNYRFQIPNFSAWITRITDEDTRPDNEGQNYIPPDSAEANPWAADSSKFYVMALSGTYIPYNWNKVTEQATRMGDTSVAAGGIILTSILDGGSRLPSFSKKDPNIMWGTLNFLLKKLDFSSITGASTTVPSTTIVDYADIYNDITGGTLTGSLCSLGVSGVDASGDYIVTAMNGNQDDWTWVFWYNATDGSYKILDTGEATLRYWSSANGAWKNITEVPSGSAVGNWDIHNVKMDQSGRYVFITVVTLEDDNVTPESTGTGNGFLASWDTYEDKITFTSPSFDGGHRSGGYGVMINQNANGSDAAQWNLRPANNLKTSPTQLIDPALNSVSSSPQWYSANPIFDEHSSFSNARNGISLPFFSSTSRDLPIDVSHPLRPFDNEALAIRTDSTRGFYRLFQHLSTRFAGLARATGYFDYSFMQVSPDGKYVLFSSNMNLTLTHNVGNDPHTAISCAPNCYRIDTFVGSLETQVAPKKCNWNSNPRCNQ